MARKGEITDKNMSVLREADVAKTQRDRKHGVVRDYSVNHRIEVFWDISPDAIRDRMCILKFDGQEAIIDAEELMRLLRWV